MDKDPPRLLVPVAESTTLRNTVAYAVREAQQLASKSAEPPTVSFVFLARRRREEPSWEPFEEEATELLDRVEVWARDDMGLEASDEAIRVNIETEIAGGDEYLFGPGDYAAKLIEYAREHNVERVVLDPEYHPTGSVPILRPLEHELKQAGLAFEEAPVERLARHRRLLGRRGGISKFAAVFGISYLFYLVLGEFSGVFDIVTGAAAAAVVSTVLYRVTFENVPGPGYTLRAFGRLTAYSVFLLWEITKANVAIAYVVLHPKLPIDPSMERFEAAVWGGLPVTTLANSITLTPGTLTVDVTGREFHVHTLTESARDDLLAGGLERAVRFVYYGRADAAVPPKIDRDADEGESA